MTTSAIGGSSGAAAAWRTQRPDPAQVVDNLFSKIDTKNQGYIDKAELQTAFDQIAASGSAGSADSASKVEAIFKKLDGDSDGKISKQEMTAGMQKLSEQFEHQFNRTRTKGADGGPPPPTADALFSQIDTKNQGFIDKEELSAALNANNSASATGQANSSRADRLFSKLDSNGDDQISKQELADGLKKTGAIQGRHRGPEGSQGPGQAGAAPPPPAAAGDADSSGSSTSTDSSSSSQVFAAADANQDGTVSFQELIAYQASQADAQAPTGAASQSEHSNASVMKMMMQLIQAYGFDQNSTTSSATKSISATA